jgi:hypothetical protein
MNPIIKSLFENDIFNCSRAEMEALGFTISDRPSNGSQPYAVIGGRSNARWWLIPLANRHVATSGLAMFQPVIPSARILKRAASTLSCMGLSDYWARNRLHISGASALKDVFNSSSVQCAFFTGTDSPHRKTAIQIMDDKGKIMGFAKVSNIPSVKRLIDDECKNLELMNALKFESVEIPHVLLFGEVAQAQVLVTDTKKTAASKTPIEFIDNHRLFLEELANKTSGGERLSSSRFLNNLKSQLGVCTGRISEVWHKRLDAAYQLITARASLVTNGMHLCHGDYTPWNTFLAGDRLYVFDWEYAKQDYPPGYDLIHFYLSLPTVKLQPIKGTIAHMRKLLRSMSLASDDCASDVLFLCYLCGHTLQYVSRELEVCDMVITWDGEQEAAAFIDALVGAAAAKVNSVY